MKFAWILTAIFGVVCLIDTAEPVFAQSDDEATEATDDTVADDEDGDELNTIDLKIGARSSTASNKNLINIVMDASGSMAYDIVDPASGEKFKRGDIVRQAVLEFVNEMKPDKTAAGLLLFGHRAFWAKKPKKSKKKSSKSDDDSDGNNNDDDSENRDAFFQGPDTTTIISQDVPGPGIIYAPSFPQNSFPLTVPSAPSASQTVWSDYEIRQSALGKEQFPDDSDAINPSFDVKQEVEVLSVNAEQLADIEDLLDRVTFETGAPTPLHQAVLEGVKQIKAVESEAVDRDVVIVTDEFNHLADAESRMKDVRLSQIRNELVGGECRIHWVLFGPEFQPEKGMSQLDPYKQQQLSRMRSLAEDFGGSLKIVQSPKQLALAMVPLLNPEKKPRLGIVQGQILRNGKPISSRSDFTVELKGSDSGPMPAPNGMFYFGNVKIGKEYSLIAKGRIRNETFNKTMEKVEAAPKAKAKGVKLEL